MRDGKWLSADQIKQYNKVKGKEVEEITDKEKEEEVKTKSNKTKK
jgi:hypothetical protein